MLPLMITGLLDGLYATEFYQNILEFDTQILIFLQEIIRNDIINPIMKIITRLGDGGVFWILLTVVLLIIPKTRKLGICSAFSLLLSVIICNVVLKNLFGRIRPYEVIDGLYLLTGIKEASDPSFPSGHTSSSFAAALSIFLASTKKQKLFTVWLLILAALISFSRLYIGIHYPTDVFASMALSIGLAFLGTFLGKKLYDYFSEKEKTKKFFFRQISILTHLWCFN
jgi:Membrane-associated phospholipid phosphatase